MLRTEKEIRAHSIAASDKEREALHQCLYIIKQFTEEEILVLIKGEEYKIDQIKEQRLSYGRPKYRKLELRQAKNHKKWLKYLIVKPKRNSLKLNRRYNIPI